LANSNRKTVDIIHVGVLVQVTTYEVWFLSEIWSHGFAEGGGGFISVPIIIRLQSWIDEKQRTQAK